MASSPSEHRPGLENKAFLLLLAGLTLAFAWIIGPFYGAVLWAVILAIMFMPLYRRLLQSMRQKRTLAALVSLVIILVVVILPLTVVAGLLVDEGSAMYERLQSGNLDIGRYFQQIVRALPPWAAGLLERFELTNVSQLQERLSAALARSSQFFAAQALSMGRTTLDFVVSLFVMLYLLFFLLRDGTALALRIEAALPLRPDHRRVLLDQLTSVIRATVRGSLVVALVQGALGGLAFWFFGIHAPVLWAALMALLSLLPAVGAALVWLPVAIYFLATGAVWQGIALTAYGILVIGLVDNVLRPMLVGKDTSMPDYVVLIATLGGIAIMGINGFVLGPVIAAMFITAWDVFAAERREAMPLSRET